MSLQGKIAVAKNRLESIGVKPGRIVMGVEFEKQLRYEIGAPEGGKITSVQGIPVEISTEAPPDSAYVGMPV